MDNPFATIDARLCVIEKLLIDIKHGHHAPAPDDGAAPAPNKVLTLAALCAYTGLPKSTVYKLTAGGKIPHSRRGKRLFFDRQAIDAWLLENTRATQADAEKAADDYLMMTRAARRTR